MHPLKNEITNKQIKKFIYINHNSQHKQSRRNQKGSVILVMFTRDLINLMSWSITDILQTYVYTYNNYGLSYECLFSH